jgi:hypothetical protein
LLGQTGLFPRQTENHQGEPVLGFSPAKLLQRVDVEEGKHHHMTPNSELQLSCVEPDPLGSRKLSVPSEARQLFESETRLRLKLTANFSLHCLFFVSTRARCRMLVTLRLPAVGVTKL